MAMQPLPAKDALIITHVTRLLNSPQAPELPPELADDAAMLELHASMLTLRETLHDFAQGNTNNAIKRRGFTFGSLKALQAHLRHFTWQVRQVASHDLTQRVDFLGELSTAFNNMITALASSRTEIEKNQEALAQLADKLKKENSLRSAALNALQESEAKFKYLADHDVLTESLNRRSFLANAAIRIRQAQLKGEFCTVAMLDVDYFKTFNDNYGHATGDEALRHMVVAAKKKLRPNDMIGRYGGEEFVFFFSGANEKAAEQMSERIRLEIESNPLRYSELSLPMTVSLGFCVIDPAYPGERDEEFLQRVLSVADAALYEAKSGGRNRVVLKCVYPDFFKQENALQK